MRTYENKNKIARYKFTVPVVVFCPLGDDYYNTTVVVEVELDKKIVDFLDLEDYFEKQLNGQHLTTEELAAEVRDTIAKEYEPKSVRVEIVGGSHIDAHTITEWKREEAV